MGGPRVSSTMKAFSRGHALLLGLIGFTGIAMAQHPSSTRSIRAIQSVSHGLEMELGALGLRLGAPIFMRIFKESSELEIFIKTKGPPFHLFKTYEICHFSGNLGPKLASGDLQSPEGFYFVKPINLNPWSQFHLSFNIGYPNRYDRFHKRTGSAIMVHGNCVSIGCYAMTDAKIEEIYTLADAALKNGQPFFRIHIFPFRMDEDRMDRARDHRWYDFWVNLKEGYDFFEQHKTPPNVKVNAKGRYVFNKEH